MIPSSGASFAFILESLCEHVYEHARPAADPIARDLQSSPIQADQTVSSRAPRALAAADVLDSDGSIAPSATLSAAASCSGHGMVVDALGSLPSIYARRSVVADSNGSLFSVDDVAARRLRKEQRRKRALQLAQEAQVTAHDASVHDASVHDEKPNTPVVSASEHWTDVPTEFCCALNGSLMKQPVLFPVANLPKT